MNRGIYTSVSGMLAAQKWMDITANNLANVSTNGFKRDAVAFADSFEQVLNAAGGRGQQVGSLSTGSEIESEYTVFENGSMVPTNQPLDFALSEPNTMFKVDLGNGQYRYTRDGAFQLNANRELVTHDGYQVMDSTDRPITIPQSGAVAADSTGQISVGDQVVAKLNIVSGTFQKAGTNLFQSNDAQTAPNALVMQGKLEGSNVNAVASMVDMIQISRLYELTQRSINQQDELTQQLIQSLRS